MLSLSSRFISLRLPAGRLVAQDGRRMSIISLAFPLKSFADLAKRLFEGDKCRYIGAYRLSQDHLELFFSCVRKRGGWNNNPSAAQFRYAYRSLLVNADVQVPATANVAPDMEGISTLRHQETTRTTEEDAEPGRTNDRAWALASDQWELMEVPPSSHLLLNGVDIRIVLRQNTEDFRLLAASTVPQKHVVQLPRIVLYIGRVQVAPTVLVGIERRLQSSPATYLLRGVEIKTRTVSPGVSHIVLDDLYPHRVTSKLLVAFVKSEAFQGSREHDPFKLEHFNLKTAVLDVGGCQQTEQFDFAQDLYMKAYMSFQHRLNRRDVPYSKGAFSKNSFLLYYILTPDREEQRLCPISTANVRLTLTFKQDLTKAITILFMSETPRVLKIDKERNVKFAG
ncbi:uncharacterized protein ISCGN_031926 [Ixodes scapularis]